MSKLSSYVFVSHASEDKVERVRPLVQALAMEGVSLWIDRRGGGDNSFQLDEDFITRYGIQGLVNGQDWDEQILHAHRACGAVLACISKHLRKERQVLVHEIVLARYAEKLVACIVDDLAYEDMQSNLGLLDGSKIQAVRIDTAVIAEAINILEADKGISSSDLAGRHKSEWQVVRELASDINKILATKGQARIAEHELEAARKFIRTIPVAPWVRPFEIPSFLYELMSDRLPDPASAQHYFMLAMGLALQCKDKAHSERQTIVSRGEVINPALNPMDAYWADVLMSAGKKSRRTLAALLVAPGPLLPAKLPPPIAGQLAEFLEWLKEPGLQVRNS